MTCASNRKPMRRGTAMQATAVTGAVAAMDRVVGQGPRIRVKRRRRGKKMMVPRCQTLRSATCLGH
jgi:hypothetical protein